MDEKHPKDIDLRPKRRKDKDNPYEIFTIGVHTDHPKYFVSFRDGNGRKICKAIEKTLFDCLNSFELEDLSYLNKVDRHIEQSELSEQMLNSRSIDKPCSVEETALRDFQYDMLYRAITELSDMQRKRILLYYFEDLTYEQIATIEGCSVHSIFISIERAKEKIKKFLS